jgi:hypothetical protein
MTDKKINQGILGEKVACNAFIELGRFVGFVIGTYDAFDMRLKEDYNPNNIINAQIKTLIPFVKERKWTVSGKKTVENFLKADEAYIVSVPAKKMKGYEDVEKYHGKLLKVNLQKLRQENINNQPEKLDIPTNDEYVQEYFIIKKEDVVELLKYPVSYFAEDPKNWK